VRLTHEERSAFVDALRTHEIDRRMPDFASFSRNYNISSTSTINRNNNYYGAVEHNYKIRLQNGNIGEVISIGRLIEGMRYNCNWVHPTRGNLSALLKFQTDFFLCSENEEIE